MTIDFDSFARASTLIHITQGAALFVLGAAEIYTRGDQDSRASLAGPLALLAAAIVMPLFMLALPGGWSLTQLRAALEIRKGFYLFVAFACLFGAAGLSRIASRSSKGGGWRALFLFFLAASGALYFTLAWRVNEEAWRQVLAWHAAIGTTLLLAVAAKAAYIFSGRRALHVCWAALLLVTSLQLLAYKEIPGAFSLRIVTFQAGPQLPAMKPAAARKNAGTADKKRSHH